MYRGYRMKRPGVSFAPRPNALRARGLVSTSAFLLATAGGFHEEEARADAIGQCIDASTQGQMLRKSGKLVASRDALIECARETCPVLVRTHCTKWLGEVESLVPSVVVRVQDAGGGDVIDARLTVDGKPAKLDGNPVELDPGEHAVTVEHAGSAPKDTKVFLAAGEHNRLVVVRLDPPPAPAARRPARLADEPPEHRVATGAWVLGGAGIAVAGAGVGFYFAALSQLHHLQSSCSPVCPTSSTQTGRTEDAVADALIGVGAAAVVGGLIWAFAFPETIEPATVARPFSIRPIAGPGLAGLAMRW
jgi:hypothetical protein